MNINEEFKANLDEFKPPSEKLNDSKLSDKHDKLNKSKDSLLSKDDYKTELPESCF